MPNCRCSASLEIIISFLPNSRLYRLGSRGRLHFHRIDLEMDFKDTPLYDVFKNGTLLNSKHVATHMSDALRLAYLFKVQKKHFGCKKYFFFCCLVQFVHGLSL